ILMRHQQGIPPHRIDHRAHLAALALSGVDRVIAIGSVGSLRPEILPGSLLIPTDYVAIGEVPTIHDHAVVHASPEISLALREGIARVVPEARVGGVYVQTRGPRIETMAEVRMLSRVADVVGMTLASEATIATELGMPFAALCSVDNYAHGLGKEVLTYEHILETARENRERTEEILQRLIQRLG
ncbi:MAG: MTAP family purine nucleoside phosphorylase, partial [Methanomicrobiales archaeon]|nr:MTAP family purine nucleoside phosphorylase [Methanomicrobiales archaeon]